MSLKLDLSNKDPLKITLAKYGSKTKAFPNSSKRMDVSIGPKPKPPDSSEKGIDSQPCSANNDQTFSSKSLLDFKISSRL